MSSCEIAQAVHSGMFSIVAHRGVTEQLSQSQIQAQCQGGGGVNGLRASRVVDASEISHFESLPHTSAQRRPDSKKNQSTAASEKVASTFPGRFLCGAANFLYSNSFPQ